MSITIEPTVHMETKRHPLPPRERLERTFGSESSMPCFRRQAAVKGVTLNIYGDLRDGDGRAIQVRQKTRSSAASTG